MSSLLALAGVLAGCIVLGIVFKPRYGAHHGCCGEALESVELEREEREKAKKRVCSNSNAQCARL